jgi:periplasmic mercuric ion binding protein
MRKMRVMVAASLFAVLGLTGAVRAETQIVVKGVHLCCPGCTAAVAKILKGVDGVKAVCDSDQGTVTITATGDDAARKAIDALAAGGFHGQSDNKDIAFKDDSGAKGMVKKLTLTGVHDCCGRCNRAIKAAIKTVPGVTSETATPRKDTFTVEGDFDAAALVKALNNAGFHVKVKE